MKQKTKIVFLISFIILFLTGMSSCVKDDIWTPSLTDEDIIKIKAEIGEVTDTRSGYMAEGKIVDGQYTLVYVQQYKNGTTYYAHADVNFGHPESPETGFASYNSNGKTKELKWSNIASNKTNLWLNNVDMKYSTFRDGQTGESFSLNTSGENISPYVMGPLDIINGTNDLQACQISATYNQKELEAHLKHVLSLAKVNIKVYPATDGHLVDLSRAKVYITNIKPRVSSINFSGSSVSIYSNEKARNMEMVTDEINWDIEKEKQEDLKNKDEEGNPILYDLYSTVDFILPPQTLSSGTDHPRLVVEVPLSDVLGSSTPENEGKIQIYSSDLPPVMFREDSSSTEDENLGAPITLSFIGGNRINLTAVINSPETELYFVPVKVESWVSKSRHNVTCDQSGMYDKDDFYEMVKAYNQKDLNTLLRYGYQLEDGTLVLQFWGSMTLEEIFGCMPLDPNIPFIFRFNDNTITVIEEDGSETKLSGNFGQTNLYNIVTGEDETTPQITSSPQMLEVAKGIKENDFDILSEYGIYTEYNNIWTFEITNSFSININEIFNIASQSDFDSEIIFNLNGHSVDVEFGNNHNFTISAINYPELLSRLIKFSPGIIDSYDFSLLSLFYNDYTSDFADILDLFGDRIENEDETTWRFIFLNNMTLNGDDVFMQMIPGGDKPEYSILVNTKITVTISGDDYSNAYALDSSNVAILYKFLKGTGSMTYNYLTTLITYYNNQNILGMWQYGYYDSVNKKWIFRIDFSSTTTTYYSNLFEKMVPNPDENFPDFELEMGSDFSLRLYSVPNTTSSYITLSGEEGLDILYEILTGTYNPE